MGNNLAEQQVNNNNKAKAQQQTQEQLSSPLSQVLKTMFLVILRIVSLILVLLLIYLHLYSLMYHMCSTLHRGFGTHCLPGSLIIQRDLPLQRKAH